MTRKRRAGGEPATFTIFGNLWHDWIVIHFSDSVSYPHIFSYFSEMFLRRNCHAHSHSDMRAGNCRNSSGARSAVQLLLR
jgi:hypothetical protein